MKKLFILLIAVAGFGVSSFGQSANTDATASATIVSSMTLTKVLDLKFGNIATGASAGKVIVDAAGSPSYPDAGAAGPTGYGVPGTISAASFDVTGSNDATYTITLPSSDVTLSGGGSTMILNTFTSSPTSLLGKLDGTGKETFTVGATLNVGAGQAPGSYSNTFNVSVNYN